MVSMFSPKIVFVASAMSISIVYGVWMAASSIIEAITSNPANANFLALFVATGMLFVSIAHSLSQMAEKMNLSY